MEQATATTTNRRLERGDGPLGGVAAGMGDYFGIDPTIIRLGLVATTLLGGPTIPIAYLAAWIIIPEAGSGAANPAAPAAPSAATPPPPPAPPAPTPPAETVSETVTADEATGGADRPQDTVDADADITEVGDDPDEEAER